MATTADLGSGTAGVWTAAQALAAGLSEGGIARRVEAGEWQHPRRGVYCDGGIELTPLMRGWVSVLACGGLRRAWAAGRTTLRLYDLPLIDDDDPATGARDADHDDVAVRAGRPGDRDTLHVRRLTFTAGADTVGVGGCPSLSLERALPGAAAVLSFEALVCVLDAGLHRRLLSANALAEVAGRAAGTREARVLRRAVRLADGRAESPNETLARLLLQPVLPGLVPQVRLRDSRGRVLSRFDLGDEELRLAVEADGKRGHAGEVMLAKDRRRDRGSLRRGWTTERVTWFDLRRRQDETVRRVVGVAQELRSAA